MRSTVEQRARRALRQHTPGLAGTALRTLGHGLDNTAFLAGDLVVRVAEGHDVVREARLLQVLRARLPLPIPEIHFADAEAGVLAYPLLPGRPLLGRDADPGLARPLGRFLRALHAVDMAEVAGVLPVEPAEPGDWLADLDGPAELLRILHCDVPPPATRLMPAHADLGAEHILERHGAVTGVIDWTDAAVTDPALDFARLFRDFGAGFLARVVAAYGRPVGDDGIGKRIVFFARCAALEDLTYGREHGSRPYLDAAGRALARLFPEAAEQP